MKSRLPVIEIYYSKGCRCVRFSQYLKAKIYDMDGDLSGVVLADDDVFEVVIFGEETDAVIGYTRSDKEPFVAFERSSGVTGQVSERG